MPDEEPDEVPDEVPPVEVAVVVVVVAVAAFVGLGLGASALRASATTDGGAGEALAHGGHGERQAQRLAPVAAARGGARPRRGARSAPARLGPVDQRGRGLAEDGSSSDQRRGERLGASPLELAQSRLRPPRSVVGERVRGLAHAGVVAKRRPAGPRRSAPAARPSTAGASPALSSAAEALRSAAVDGVDTRAAAASCSAAVSPRAPAPGLVGERVGVAVRQDEQGGRRELRRGQRRSSAPGAPPTPRE